MVRISSSLPRDLGTGAPPKRLLNPEAIQLSTTTKGVNSHDITSIGRAYIRDSLSACWVAMVLGVVSQNIRRMMVTIIVAMRTPCSGQNLIAMAVARAAAAVLTKLLPRRMVDSSLSGRWSILATRSAPLTLVLTICSILILCKAIKAVSELEKKADKRRQTKRNTRYSVSIDI